MSHIKSNWGRPPPITPKPRNHSQLLFTTGWSDSQLRCGGAMKEDIWQLLCYCPQYTTQREAAKRTLVRPRRRNDLELCHFPRQWRNHADTALGTNALLNFRTDDGPRLHILEAHRSFIPYILFFCFFSAFILFCFILFLIHCLDLIFFFSFFIRLIVFTPMWSSKLRRWGG